MANQANEIPIFLQSPKERLAAMDKEMNELLGRFERLSIDRQRLVSSMGWESTATPVVYNQGCEQLQLPLNHGN